MNICIQKKYSSPSAECCLTRPLFHSPSLVSSILSRKLGKWKILKSFYRQKYISIANNNYLTFSYDILQVTSVRKSLR